MRSKLIPDDTITEFLNGEAPGMIQATDALQAAQRILAADTGIGDEDYRAIERALNRAGNAETVSFVRETLETAFLDSAEVPVDPPRPSRF